jgi:hypothetical protein
MRSFRHCLLFPIAAIVLVHCSAQSPTSTSGTVFDPSGATVQGCELQLASTEGVLLQQTKTDSHGVFHLKSLAPGDYTLAIPADHGFAAENIPIHIIGGKMPSLDVHLRLPEVNEKVDVADDSSDVATDPGANSDQVTASAQLIEKIPVLNQDVISTFTPFLSQTGVNSKGVTLVVDGIETKSSGVSVSAIKSVSINNDPYTAEARSPGKGRIEILTKAGTPRFHGTFNFTFRDASTDAITPFAIAPPVEQRRIYEGNITGPLGRGGKTTFLISGTRKEDNLQAIVDQKAILAAGLAGSATNIDTPIHTTLFAVRAARELTPSHRVSLQYNVEDVVTRNQGVGGLVLGDAGVNTQSREDDIVFNDSYTVSPTIVNQLQLFFEKDHNPVRSVVDAQKVIVDGTFTSGGAQADVLDTENNLKINEIVSWSKGRHFVKAGIVIPNLSRRAWEDHGNRLGTLKFASLAAYNAKLPYSFTQQAGPGRAVFWANEIGVFALDQIQLRPNLQMSLGIRYDWQTYFDSPHNFSPRFSIAYAPGKQRRSILRVGAGVFYDRAGARPISELKRFNGTVLRAITILNPNYANPIPVGESIATLPTDLVTTAPDASIPLLTYFSVGVDHQLAKGTSIAFTYRGNLGLNMFRSADINAPLGPDYLTLPNPAFGVVRQIQTSGRQVSNALDITFKGAGRWFNGLAQYTLSHTENNTGGIGWFPANQYDDSGEYARADFDQLQRFNLLGTFNEGHWLSLGLAANLYSGTPYTETSGVDTFNTGILNARPAGIGRNTLTTAGYANLDLRWSHDFALPVARDIAPTATFAVDAFNSLNRTNYSAYTGNVQSQFFEQPTSALPARRIQFTARFKF